ncbi:MAG: non-ribosomal peptide synthetase [Gammaproteobacteria bacterium]
MHKLRGLVDLETAYPARPGFSGDPSPAFVEFKKSEIEQSIANCFEQRVQRYAERTAVKTRRDQYTYRELNQAANRIARAVIAQCGGQSNQQVALLLEHDAALVAAILAVLKAGHVYVPLDPAFPYARNCFILEDAQAQLLVTNSKNFPLAQSLIRGDQRLLNIDELDAGLTDDNLGLAISPDQLAYILYTSGSTGQPKGVMQNHRNVLNDLRQYTNTLYISCDDRMTLLYSCSVNGAVRGIYGALLNGAALYPMAIKQEGLSRLANWLVEEEITFYHSVPTVFRHFTETLTPNHKFPKLRLIRFGGERVLASDVAAYKKHFSDTCILYTGMGATETGHVREFFIDKHTKIPGGIVPAGYAIEDKQVLLLDAEGAAVGLNREGEITVKSRYLSLGYWRKPELTQAAFKADLCGGDERIYRTGDLGRMHADGLLEHLGRKDFQVKVRGYRIEVAEIELMLLDLPEIKEAVVMGREDSRGEQSLIAYVVPDPAAQASPKPPTPSKLRTLLKTNLPDYMVPSTIIMMDSLPLTPNGKLDRRALPALGEIQAVREDSFVAARTPLEESLVCIWADLLKMEKVGVHDNFFELGADSLLGMQIITRVNSTLQVELVLPILFENPTIAELALAIIQAQSATAENQEIKYLLDQLSSISDAEAQQLIDGGK